MYRFIENMKWKTLDGTGSMESSQQTNNHPSCELRADNLPTQVFLKLYTNFVSCRERFNEVQCTLQYNTKDKVEKHHICIAVQVVTLG